MTITNDDRGVVLMYIHLVQPDMPFLNANTNTFLAQWVMHTLTPGSTSIVSCARPTIQQDLAEIQQAYCVRPPFNTPKIC